MAFQGIEFIYDGISSSAYNLYMMDTSTNDESTLSNFNIITDKTNLSNNYVLGMIEDSPLEFPLSIMCDGELDRHDVSVISKAFFNKPRFCKLQILQEDMMGVYYNCKLNNVKLITMSNRIIGFKCTAVCDGSFAYEFPRKIARQVSNRAITIPIINNGDSEYVKPIIKLYPNKANGIVTIENSQEPNKKMEIKNLIVGEVITIDCKYKIIKSSGTDYMYERFNNCFIRLCPNRNEITVVGDISKIEIEYQLQRRIGG